jgi:Leucine-rich repeat (LRR) protein
MNTILLLLLAQSLIIFTSSKPNEEPNLSTSEFNALYDLYNATAGRYWRWENESYGEIWNFQQINPNPCSQSWQGITCQCSNELCELKELYLSSYNLTGTLPESVGNWKELSLFDVQNNSIRGQIPENISKWNQINDLDVQFNRFSGSIPNSLWSLTNLSFLNLNNNAFNPSTVPVSIGNLTNLKILQMCGIRLYGTIPEIISNCQKIEKLYVAHNNLTGLISKGIGNLKSLVHLDLHDNYLTGIHEEFFNATSLREFYLYQNLISSTLSPRIANLVSLIEFDVSSNQFYGTLPSSLQQIPKLGYIFINSNKFSGEVPAWLSNITTLIRFAASFNYFYGSLPQSLSNIRRLKEFTISTNLVSGAIPSSFQNLSFLQSMDLSYNSFRGPVNALFDGCPSLKYMVLGYNFFSGKINNSQSMQLAAIDVSSNQLSGSPPYFDVGDERLLTYLQFGRNYFSGELPLNLPQSLLIFSVDSNYLFGTVPDYVFSSLNLITLNISFNLFSGSFPDSHSSDIPKLQELIVNNNFFVGSLPSSIGYFYQLVSLSLNSNQFTSTVPKSYKNLTALEQFFIQDNLISGSVTELLNNTLSYSLFAVDLTNNQLTGSLVESYFVKSTLRTFAAVSNCLSGSIPLTVCDAKSLTTFAIDGVSTAKNCRKLIYPILFSGFIVEQYLTGTIPNCLFALSALTTLHLSGNSFTGTISNNLNISASLIDLSLSHNSLSGTIPLFVQERSWTNLDLSYNKLTGTLSSTFAEISNNGSLSLQVNRLSGIIPNSLLTAKAVNILDGNIFTCNTIEELPISDPNRNTYSCGSNTVDELLYFWISLFGVILFLFVTLWISKKEKNGHNSFLKWSLIETLSTELKKWNNTIDDYGAKNPNSNLIALVECFEGIRRVCVIMSSFAILVLLPVYVGLSENSKTYEEGYVWIVSGVLLSGKQSAITLFFVFLVLLLLLFLLLFLIFGDTLLFNLKSFVDNKLPTTFLRRSNRFSNASNLQSTLKETEAERMKSNQMTYPRLYFTHFIVFFLNTVIVGAVDCSYVIILLNESSTVIIFAALFLACFRLINGKVLLWKAIPLVAKRVKFTVYKTESSDDEGFESQKQIMSKQTSDRYDFTLTDIIFLERMMIFNNIILPIIAIIVILPDCFYNTFVTASNVNANYQYIGCQLYQFVLFGFAYYFLQTSICTTVTANTSFSPPFIYLFQCSSKIMINYIPVYIIKFILAGFVIPCYTLVIKYLYDHYYAKAHFKNKENNKNMRMEASSIDKCLFNVFDYLVNRKMRNYSNDNESTSNHQDRILFDKLKFTVDLSSYFVIIVCFGALFPPLMVMGSFSIVIITYFEELQLKRILYESNKENLGWCEKTLEKNCYGVKELCRTTIWKSTIFISCSLFAFILFDTWGDEEGWLSALPITFSMMCFPISCIFVIQMISQRFKSSPNSCQSSNEYKTETEMVIVNVMHGKEIETEIAALEQ